jgi:small-conductance mechanosensitive channel
MKELSRSRSVLPVPIATRSAAPHAIEEALMNGLIYIVGLIVVIMFILSFLGLR